MSWLPTTKRKLNLSKILTKSSSQSRWPHKMKKTKQKNQTVESRVQAGYEVRGWLVCLEASFTIDLVQILTFQVTPVPRNWQSKSSRYWISVKFAQFFFHFCFLTWFWCLCSFRYRLMAPDVFSIDSAWYCSVSLIICRRSEKNFITFAKITLTHFFNDVTLFSKWKMQIFFVLISRYHLKCLDTSTWHYYVVIQTEQDTKIC